MKLESMMRIHRRCAILSANGGRYFRSAILLLVAATLAGCSSEPARFQLDMVTMVDNEVQQVNQQAIADILVAVLGTPDQPRAPAGSGLDIVKLRQAAGAVHSDQAGVKHGLYREHCAHCHGVSGDGRGPTAMFLNPYPRDYRLGLFKFKSTTRAQKPTDDDLRRILFNGINGTAMPSFKLLPDDELAALVEYVKYLAIRGQVERELVNMILEDVELDEKTDLAVPVDPVKNAEHRQLIQDRVAIVFEQWTDRDGAVVRPDPAHIPSDDRTAEEVAASIAKGRELFFGKADCLKCHGPTALGDGQTTDYNDWQKSLQAFVDKTAGLIQQWEDPENPLTEKQIEQLPAAQEQIARRRAVEQSLFPIRTILPRNLRAGVYRGGRRPIDLFWRIHQGTNGTPMPGGSSSLTEQEIWNIVDYIRSLPYEPASRPQVKMSENQRLRL